MNKYVLTISIFTFTIIGCLCLLSLLNSLTPSLDNGSSLPSDINRRQYALTGLEYDPGMNGYPIHLDTTETNDPLGIVMTTRTMTLYQDGNLLYRFDRKSPYSRIILIPLNLQPNSHSIDLLLSGLPQNSAIPSLFRSAPENTPRVIIGTLDNLQRSSQFGSDMTMIIIGIYIMAAFSGMVLFLRKNTERYLLYLALVSGIDMITTLITTGSGPFQTSFETYLNLRPLLFIIPVMLNNIICLHLYRNSLPDLLTKVISFPVLFIVSIVAILIQSLTTIVTYHFIRRILWLPTLILLANAISNRQRDSLLLLLSYALSESIALFLYLTTLLGTTGSFSTYIRLSEFSNMLFILSCIFIAYDRFASKFREAESLFSEVSILNKQLEKKVDERTQQLKEQQEKKHNLMLNIFHDLRSPIFISRQRISQITVNDDRSKESITVINDRLHYMEVLTEELFLSAKLESNAVLFDEDYVDLQEILSRLVRNQASFALEHGLTITLNADDPMNTWGDSYRLEQAFQNIINNAIQSPPPGGTITISATQEENQCHILIADTGRGIPEEDLPKIFERYYRIDNRHSFTSSGLGLSIAKDIIEAHRGSITVHSKIKEGSVFTITLPLIK